MEGYCSNLFSNLYINFLLFLTASKKGFTHLHTYHIILYNKQSTTASVTLASTCVPCLMPLFLTSLSGSWAFSLLNFLHLLRMCPIFP